MPAKIIEIAGAHGALGVLRLVHSLNQMEQLEILDFSQLEKLIAEGQRALIPHATVVEAAPWVETDAQNEFRQNTLRLYRVDEPSPQTSRLWLPDMAKDVHALLKARELGVDAHHPSVRTFALWSGQVHSAPQYSHVLDPARFTNLVPRPYSAADYPVQVPTFYLQGGWDSATFSPGADRHFLKSARGVAQLFHFRDLGHMPIGNLLARSGSGAKSLAADLRTFLVQILSGSPVDTGSPQFT